MCEKRKISIAVLEKECGIANGTIGKWNLRKSSPSVATVQKIADYFGVTVGYLLK
jgi:transcriptional regulator with XRE-family HTH domain